MLGSVSRATAAALAAVVGAMAATVAVTPEFRERGGTDVILDAPALGLPGRVLLLVISAAAAGIIFRAIRSSGRNSGTARVTIEVIAVSIGVGVLAGLGYRIVTAKSVGANIGGGLVLLASPMGALAFIAYLAGASARCAYRAALDASRTRPVERDIGSQVEALGMRRDGIGREYPRVPFRRIRRWRVVPLYGRRLGDGLTQESADAVSCPQNDSSA